jgi:putative PIG3 family NAD(P)H quinone oxidoreductase
MATMRAVKHAGRDAPLVLEDLPIPEPGENEVLIKVAAAGVNRPDVLQRAGGYPPPPGAPNTMGLEVAGEIAKCGANAARWKIGDKVVALLGGGGYAEYARAPEGSCLPMPKALSAEEAAGLCETVFTVWANVFESAALKPGEAFLVHGGASGIGTTAIQMAKAHGAAKIFATAGDDAKCAACEKLGARAINYKTQDWARIVQDEGGADVILDMVGGDYVAKNFQVARFKGRVTQIAFLGGASVQINLGVVMQKQLVYTGSTLRNRPIEEKARLARAIEQHVWPWIEAGKLKPLIDGVYPLAEAEAAHKRMTDNANSGKIILRV